MSDFKPIPESEFSFLRSSDNGRSKKVDFIVNGNHYQYLYNYGRNYGFIFINKYASKEALDHPLTMAGSEQIYSSTMPTINTAEGILIEFSLSKLNLTQLIK